MWTLVCVKACAVYWISHSGAGVKGLLYSSATFSSLNWSSRLTSANWLSQTQHHFRLRPRAEAWTLCVCHTALFPPRERHSTITWPAVWWSEIDLKEAVSFSKRRINRVTWRHKRRNPELVKAQRELGIIVTCFGSKTNNCGHTLITHAKENEAKGYLCEMLWTQVWSDWFVYFIYIYIDLFIDWTLCIICLFQHRIIYNFES